MNPLWLELIRKEHLNQTIRINFKAWKERRISLSTGSKVVFGEGVLDQFFKLYDVVCVFILWSAKQGDTHFDGVRDTVQRRFLYRVYFYLSLSLFHSEKLAVNGWFNIWTLELTCAEIAAELIL